MRGVWVLSLSRWLWRWVNEQIKTRGGPGRPFFGITLKVMCVCVCALSKLVALRGGVPVRVRVLVLLV